MQLDMFLAYCKSQKHNTKTGANARSSKHNPRSLPVTFTNDCLNYNAIAERTLKYEMNTTVIQIKVKKYISLYIEGLCAPS